jgi:hypothetical protein
MQQHSLPPVTVIQLYTPTSKHPSDLYIPTSKHPSDLYIPTSKHPSDLYIHSLKHPSDLNTLVGVKVSVVSHLLG